MHRSGLSNGKTAGPKN